jgi:hypothetical protein
MSMTRYGIFAELSPLNSATATQGLQIDPQFFKDNRDLLLFKHGLTDPQFFPKDLGNIIVSYLGRKEIEPWRLYYTDKLWGYFGILVDDATNFLMPDKDSQLSYALLVCQSMLRCCVCIPILMTGGGVSLCASPFFLFADMAHNAKEKYDKRAVDLVIQAPAQETMVDAADNHEGLNNALIHGFNYR